MLITVLCLMSGASVEKLNILKVPYKDKLVHFFFYYIFTFCWFYFFRKIHSNTPRLRFLLFASAVVYGILIEVFQMFMSSGRDAEIGDVLANTLGSAMAILVLWLSNKKK